MDRHSSSASTFPSLDDDFERNIWNPLLNLLFLEQVSCIVASRLVDIDLARIALTCHFALDLLCYKEEVLDSARRSVGRHCPWSSFCFCGTIAHPGVIVFLLCLARYYKILISNWLLPLAGAVYSRVVSYPHVALVSLDSSPREERS